MFISKIQVSNFRLLRDISINCEKDLSLIIGKNNCGKTSLLSVLNKCIGKTTENGNFDYFDFSIAFQNKLFDVVKEKSAFDEDELKGIQVDIYIDYDEKDDLTNISNLFLDLDPDNHTVVLRFNYLLKENLDELKGAFEVYKQQKTKSEEKSLFLKFMSKHYKEYFEFKRFSVLFDYKNKKVDNNTYKPLVNKDIDLSKIIAFNYVSARRNVSNNDNSELSTLAGNYYERTKSTDGNDITSAKIENEVDNTDNQFNEIYVDIFKPLTDKISKFGGMRKNDTTLKVVSQIKALNLLKNNTTVVYDDEKSFLPENYNGLGFLNLFNIIMSIEIQLCDFRKESKKDEKPADINLLFIEEPEAHTHPQMQYIFIKNIKELLKDGRKIKDTDKEINLQTFMTTHSSHIVSECDFDDIKYFVKNNENHNVVSKNLKDLKTLYQKEKGEDNNHFKFLKQYLTLSRSEVFFADKIILIEGDTERILLPAMIRKIDQENEYDIPLSSQNISIIEVGNYSEIYSEFINFLGIKTLIITDIDTEAFEEHINKKGEKIQKLCSAKVDVATHTGNPTLKYYLKCILADKEEQAKEILTGLTIEQKTLTGSHGKDGTLSWRQNPEGDLLIVYQTEEKNSKGKNYNARSFEDAFFHINRDLFTNRDGQNVKEKAANCRSLFQGLKNVSDLFDTTKDSFFLAENCVNRKPSLAMDILLNSETKEGKDFSNWNIPHYIKEGLEWLQKN